MKWNTSGCIDLSGLAQTPSVKHSEQRGGGDHGQSTSHDLSIVILAALTTQAKSVRNFSTDMELRCLKMNHTRT